MDVITPHVLRCQKPVLYVNSAASASIITDQPLVQGKDHFINNLQCKLESAVAERDKEQNLQLLRMDCVTSKLSRDGSQQGALAIRAELFQERCIENDVSPIKPN
ncbi:hypothetical protein OS493_012970 [Desmophyllum pertusum]|uniref:Uncharacterized protein n=1 Tax=Desmophyllum pertusum TaxID=174260 RepID=A0A9X0CT85_9CNID|nr:hypothetical protein OS493_012970 [Desmophyllum pertusum]